MQPQVKQWVRVSAQLRKNLEHWALTVNALNVDQVVALYHPKARLFPSFGTLKVGQQEILAFLKEANIQRITLSSQSVSYNPEENLVEGEYELKLTNGKIAQTNFALKFDSKNLIVEHAAAPIKTSTWSLKNEVSVCTLLTSATVKSVLKDSQHQLFPSRKEVSEL